MKKMLLLGLVLLALAFAVPADAQVCMGGAPGCPSGGGAAGSGGITAGAAATGCSAFSYVYVDTSGNLACARAPINGATATAGTAITSQLETISGSSAASNWHNLTGTFPGTLSAETNAVNISVTGDNDAQIQNGLKVSLVQGAASYTGGPLSVVNTGTLEGTAALFDNQTVGANTVTSYGSISKMYNANATTRRHVGGLGAVGGATLPATSVGLQGLSEAGGKRVGVLGSTVTSATGTGGIGVYAQGGTTVPTIGADIGISSFAYFAALVANNTAATTDIAIFTDNTTAVSTTAAWAGTNVKDGGWLSNGNGVLTSATMTPTITADTRTSTHSYAWTNAMVTALGAVLVGDITVATLPAKTQINNAYVVIDTAAGGVTTLTVSCGDAIAGTPFINYIVASDARAAANTLYGDAVAERGTSIDVEFYYVPSYTATTLVTCHFISTGTNLNTVTTSTGRLILTTTLLP